LKSYVPWQKIIDDIPYKDIERCAIEFLMHNQDKGKQIPVKTAHQRFMLWLKPKFETEEERKTLMAKYHEKLRRSAFKKSQTVQYSENEEKREFEPIQSKISRIPKNIREEIEKKASEDFENMDMKISDTAKISARKIFITNRLMQWN
jgi:hypothetical protein